MIKSSLFPLRNPSPSFDAFRDILLGKQMPEKVHFIELGVDYEMMKFISESLMGFKAPENINVGERKKELFVEGKVVPALLDEEKPLLKFRVKFYYSMGYDCVPVGLPLAPFPTKHRKTKDTALLSRGIRTWVEEEAGIITNWDEFESFPWDRINLDVTEYFEFLSEIIPEGMKFMVASTLYEMVGEQLMGWKCMFYKLFTDPDLVKAVFDKWGEIIYRGYTDAISHDCVGAIFHCDDMGYKKGTMIRP
ncbi:MAG TPA: hypothetical protein ENG65_05960, partial [Candidatus Bathyarchaeota archaeon]|nr:hypothetical protein [Candidatus Bathyarchaeota archaeon]